MAIHARKKLVTQPINSAIAPSSVFCGRARRAARERLPHAIPERGRLARRNDRTRPRGRLATDGDPNSRSGDMPVADGPARAVPANPAEPLRGSPATGMSPLLGWLFGMTLFASLALARARR